MKILVLTSSLNPERSLSRTMCEYTAGELASHEGVEVDIIDLNDYENLGYHHRESEAMREIKEETKMYDGFVFGMPVYNFGINDSLKAFLDAGFAPQREMLPVGMLCAAGGEKSYMAATSLAKACMIWYRMLVMPRFVYATHKQWDKETGELGEDILARCSTLAHDIVQTCRGQQLANQEAAEKRVAEKVGATTREE